MTDMIPPPGPNPKSGREPGPGDAALAPLALVMALVITTLMGGAVYRFAPILSRPDRSPPAHRALFNAASSRAHGLRRIEAVTVPTTRRLVHVERTLRDRGLDVWSRVQEITLAARTEGPRSEVLRKCLAEKVKPERGHLTLRGLHEVLEKTVRSAIQSATGS